MKKFKKLVTLLLLFLLTFCFCSGCTDVPKDEIHAYLVTSRIKYLKDEGVTEVFAFLDVLNGKERAIKGFEMDISIDFANGTHANDTVNYNETIRYAKSQPVTFIFYVQGKVDAIEITAFRFSIYTYWQTFGKHIITTVLIYIAITVLLFVLNAAEMFGWMVLISAGSLIFGVIYALFMPISQSIFIIIGTVISLIPYVVYKYNDSY